MGVLKANIGGVWTPIGYGSNPISWESAAYTPTLGGMAIGTGGSAGNIARYTYIGGSQVGEYGLLVACGRITFGTTGTTLPGGSAETISFPPGFDHALLIGFVPIGWGNATRQGVSTDPVMLCDQSGAQVRVWSFKVDATYPVLIDTAATIPIAWANGDILDWGFQTQVKRV